MFVPNRVVRISYKQFGAASHEAAPVALVLSGQIVHCAMMLMGSL